MLLNDKTIRLLSVDRQPPMIEPFSEGVQGGGIISYGLSHAGYDLRLGTLIRKFKVDCGEVLDPKRFNDEAYLNRVTYTETYKVGDGVIIAPGDGFLGYSQERISIPDWLKGRCLGKSTYARCFVFPNITPLEPGWEGHLTMEISNLGKLPVKVYVGEGIAQLEFEQLTGLPEVNYEQKGGKYQNQGATPVPARVKE